MEQEKKYLKTIEEVSDALAAEELGEMAKAVNEENTIAAMEEALDTISVLVRYLEGDR